MKAKGGWEIGHLGLGIYGPSRTLEEPEDAEGIKGWKAGKSPSEKKRIKGLKNAGQIRARNH